MKKKKKTVWLEKSSLVRLQVLCFAFVIGETWLLWPHLHSLCSGAATVMGTSMVEDPDNAIHELAACSLLIGYLWFAKRLKKPLDLLLSCCLMPPILALTSSLLEGSLDGTDGPPEGSLDRTNTMDEMLLGLPAWFFASKPWKLCSVSFGMHFECLILGVKTLELLQTWNLLEFLGVMALLMEQTVEPIISLLTWWQVIV